MTLIEHLQLLFPAASKSTLRGMVEDGRVRINGHRARTLKIEIGANDKVEVTGRAAPPPPPVTPLEIRFEDDDLLIIHKPAGLLTSTVPGEKRLTAERILRQYVEAKRGRLGIIHRLDADASGILVFSKNEDAFHHLKQQFFEHSVERVYHALVKGTPKERKGRIETRLVEYADGSVHSTTAPGKGESAITDYELIETRDARAMLRVMLHTGRKHQIRAHLSEMGHPIVGDKVYSGDPAPRLMLAAVRLGLTHPRTGKRMSFEGSGI